MIPHDLSAMLDGAFAHPFDTDNDASTLEANGRKFDLKDPAQAEKAQEYTEHQREALREGQLKTYEEHSTDFGEGGRTRLLYDELRAKMACDFHAGKHQMTWEEQSVEADRIRSIRAAELHKAGKF